MKGQRSTSKNAIVRISILSLGLLAMTSCVSRQRYDELARDRDRLSGVLEDLRQYQDQLDQDNKELRARNAQIAAELEGKDSLVDSALSQKAKYQEGLKELEEAIARLSASGSPSGESGDVEWIKTAKGGTAVRIGGSLLFGLGKAELTPEGEKLLRSLADELRERQHIGIKVVGHTDNTRFAKKETIEQYPFGNLHLSAMRAIVVASFLERECRIPSNRVWIEAFGEHQPVVPNDTTDHKARNRRVEIHFVEME